jgi:hypothetical protein
MEILPLAYKMAASCAAAAGQTQLADDYNGTLKKLHNDHGIDVSQITEVGY